MINHYSQNFLNHSVSKSSIRNKNKNSIFLYKKQKSYHIFSLYKADLNFKKSLDIDFLSLKSNINVSPNRRNISRSGFKKLISSFLIRSGKSKKLESKIYSSYTYFSKKYPEYWMDKHIELFFTKYAFPLIYAEKYRIFKKRRSKKPHYARQSLNTNLEQKYIFNFFKEFLSKKLTRNFKQTFQYHFLTLTSNRLGLTSVQKNRTKENVTKWNKFSKAARTFRNERRKISFLNRKKNVNVHNKRIVDNIHRKSFLTQTLLSEKFLLESSSHSGTHFLNKKNNNQYKGLETLNSLSKTKPRFIYWFLSKSLLKEEQKPSWNIKNDGVIYNFSFTNSFFWGYKKHLLSSSYVRQLDLPFTSFFKRRLNVNRDYNFNILDKPLSTINYLSSIRSNKGTLYQIGLKKNLLILFKNKENFSTISVDGKSKYPLKSKKKQHKKLHNDAKLFSTKINQLFPMIHLLFESAKWNSSHSFNRLRILDLLKSSPFDEASYYNNESSFKFTKKKPIKHVDTHFDMRKISKYKNFYISQKKSRSLKAHRYNKVYSELIKGRLASYNTNLKFNLKSTIKGGRSYLTMNFKENFQPFPFMREKNSTLNSFLVNKAQASFTKGRQKLLFKKFASKFDSVLFNMSLKLKAQKFEKVFNFLLYSTGREASFDFKPNNFLILNALNNESHNVSLEDKNKPLFPIMFKITSHIKVIITIESYSKEIIQKIKESFKNSSSKLFDAKDIDIKYTIGAKKIKRLALLTSPHVNKIAQQHFEKISYKEFIEISFCNRKLLNSSYLIKWIRTLNNSSHMSKISLKVVYI